MAKFLFLWVVLASMALTLGAVPRSFAEEVAPTGEYKEGLHVDGWTVFPSIFVGAVYNNNIDQTGTDTNSGTSLRVTPHLAGTYDG
jgi:hypothetical protein